MPDSITTFPNIDFRFRRGFLDSFLRTPIKNGSINFIKDSKELYVDVDNTRIKISSIVYDGGTEADIRALIAPENKIYISSDTFKLLFFDKVNMKWRVVGTDTIETANHAISADTDSEGNKISEYYYPAKHAIIDQEIMLNEIEKISNAVGSIIRFKTELLLDESELPVEGSEGVIYLIPAANFSGTNESEIENSNTGESDSNTTDDIYVELMWVVDPDFGGYYEIIGKTTVNLSNYYPKTEVDNMLALLKNEMTDSIKQTRSELINYVNELRSMINTVQSSDNTRFANITNQINSINNTINSINSNITSVNAILETI